MIRSKALDILFKYGTAFLSCGVAYFFTQGLRPLFDTHFFEFFQAAVVISAWYGGRGPGVVAATLSFLLIDYFFLHPILAFTMSGTDFWRLVIFELVALLTSSLSGKLKRSNAQLEAARHDLELRVEQRTKELYLANEVLTNEVAHRLEAEKALLDISNREQRRLGQDLHDGLGQILAGVKFMTRALRESLTQQSIPDAERVATIESQLREALSYVDTVSRGLYPVELEAHGLTAALHELAERTSAVYSVVCRFLLLKQISFDDGALTNHLYRIAQEAVMNALKSGHARRIHIRLFERDNKIMLSIADNGIGIGNVAMRKGMGIKMMEYRARVIQGKIKFRSRPNGGTLVVCEIPKGALNESR